MGCTMLFRLLLLLLAPLSASAIELEDISQPIYTGQVLLQATDPDPVVLHITKFHAPSSQFAILEPTISALEKAFGKGKLQVEVFRGAIFDASDAHLLITTAGAYRRYYHLGGRDIATLASDTLPNPNRAEGSVFVVLDKRADLQTLDDLTSARLAATSPFSFSNHQIAMLEMFNQGLSPKNTFASRIWTDDLVKGLVLLKQEKVDVAIVRACTLETLQKVGVDTSEFRVLSPKKVEESFPCLTSTDLYPNWTFSVTQKADPVIAKKAAQAILTMEPQANNLHWSIATDFTLVDELMYQLKDGQFEYIEHWSLKQFVGKYATVLMLAVIVFFAICLHSWRSDFLLKRRTDELMKAQQDVLRINETLEHLQKVGIVGQISTIIAHELRQPLSVVIGYIHGIQRLMEQQSRIDYEMLSDALTQIKEQVGKIDAIVSRVRQYAKQQQGSRKRIDLAQTIRQSVNELQKFSHLNVPVQCEVEHNLMINANPLEMHLMIINLLRNAIQATKDQTNGLVLIKGTNDGDEIVITIIDNGPKLQESEFQRLLEPLQSNKLTGLGLGLTIVGMIIENHAGTLSVSQNQPQGLIFKICLPSAQN